MIVHYCICDQCGTQTKIDDDRKNLFEIYFTITPLWTKPFDNEKAMLKDTGNLLNKKMHVKQTFCDKECFVNYVKAHMGVDGTFEYTKEDKERAANLAKENMKASQALNPFQFSATSIPFTLKQSP